MNHQLESLVEHLAQGDSPKKAVAAMRCLNQPIGCGQPVKDDFKDRLSMKEYTITGLCQRCQDSLDAIAKAMEEEDDD